LYTEDDLAALFKYNATYSIFKISPKGRFIWNTTYGDLHYLQTVLSRPLESEQDLAQLRKQLKAAMVAV
jgi:hypothetical protein